MLLHGMSRLIIQRSIALALAVLESIPLFFFVDIAVLRSDIQVNGGTRFYECCIEGKMARKQRE